MNNHKVAILNKHQKLQNHTKRDFKVFLILMFQALIRKGVYLELIKLRALIKTGMGL
jgi:hypothetical protein